MTHIDSDRVVHPLTRALAAEIRAELGRRQTTQSAAARALSRSEMYVSRRVATATRSITVCELAALADWLGVDPVDLLRRAAAARAA